MPLYSKVLESFVLNKMKDEISLSTNQYEGMKGCSTSHFLLDSWNDILTALEHPGSAVNLISVDFEKAFNRMDHTMCLEALVDMDALDVLVDWIATFLYGRKMSVKIGKSKSVPKPVNGSSPQGSILGNYLFCVTTNRFADLADTVQMPRNITWSTSTSSSDDEPAQLVQTDENIVAHTTSTPRLGGNSNSLGLPATYFRWRGAMTQKKISNSSDGKK